MQTNNPIVKIPAKVDGTWVRCGNCNAKLFEIETIFRKGEPNCLVGIKCKAKSGGKTCNSLNQIVL